MNVPAIQASAYAVAFVALNLESKRQMAGGHGGAKRIGARRPLGEAAKLVLKSLTHEEKSKFRTSGYKRSEKETAASSRCYIEAAPNQYVLWRDGTMG